MPHHHHNYQSTQGLYSLPCLIIIITTIIIYISGTPFHLQKALSIKWREQMTHQVGKHSNLYSYTNYMLYKHFKSLNSQSTHYRNNFGAWGQLYNHKINPKTISHLTVWVPTKSNHNLSPPPPTTHTLCTNIKLTHAHTDKLGFGPIAPQNSQT